jgi:23S rRNA pseudouridine2604 synthase
MGNTNAAGGEGIRLNKYLSAAGICSRREADQLVSEGKVTIDGAPATLGSRVRPGQKVVCDGREVGDLSVERPKPVLLAVNKPRGIVCTTTDNDRAQNIVEFLNYPVRIYPVGRLDKESDGLVLMTNEGELVNKILRARYFHEKEYVVAVDKPLTDEFLRQMSEGVYLSELKVKTRPCRVIRMGQRSFRIILTQGINRQIRRMCEELGYHVRTLKRIRIMNIRLDGLEKGQYREIQGEELRELLHFLDHPDAAAEESFGRKESGSGHGYFDGNENRGSARGRFAGNGSQRSGRFSGNGSQGSGRFAENGSQRSGRSERTGVIRPGDGRQSRGEGGERNLRESGEKTRPAGRSGKAFDKSHKISIARRTEGDHGGRRNK